jgi:hypothetical protein
MATTTTNFGWDIPQSTDLVKDGATAIAALGQDIDTALVDLKGGTTGQVLAKASNTDLDYSWVAQDDSNAIQNAIVDAKGDLISATAADTPARLAVGTNNQVLTADSTTATGLKWATPATSTSGFTFISRSTFSNVATVDLDSIFTSTYNVYQIVLETVYGTNVSDDLAIQLRYAGPTTETAGYYGKTASLDVTYGVTNNNNASSVTALVDIRNSAAQASSGSFFISNVGNASENPIGYLVGFSGGALSANTAGFYQVTARTYTGLRFVGVGGNITGNISVYGMAKA